MRAGGPQTTAVTMVLAGILSVQFGSAVATELFDDVGPVGGVMLRLVIGAVILVAIARPSLAALRGPARRDLLLFGVALAGMNTAFYLSLDRIPLGIAVTLEFVGPLGVAIAGSRRRLDLVWAGLAALGILLLSPSLGDSLDLLGAALALLAGAFWAAYILLAARVGAQIPGTGGLALAMAVGAAIVLPAGLIAGGDDLLGGEALALGLAVAMLSSVIPYSLELEALRRLTTGVFGVLMSLEPAAAAAIGFVALGQSLGLNEALAIACVIAASAGALRNAPPPVEGS